MTARGLISDQGAITEEMMQYRFFYLRKLPICHRHGKSKKTKAKIKNKQTNKKEFPTKK